MREITKRFVVGKIGSGPDGHFEQFDTMEEVVAYQETLDQDALHNGEYYLDDMNETEDEMEPGDEESDET